MQNALVFQSTTFDVIDRNNQPWLKSQQIAAALGYSDDTSITKVFSRHASEFTDSMTGTVKLTASGNLESETRIFSLRGAHLLGMFARTEKAAEFRRWVLDILDHETQPVQPALPEFITASQAGELATLIAERFPDGKDRPYAWGRFNNHFRLSGYKTLPASRFEEACAYIPTMPRKDDMPTQPIAPVLGMRILTRLEEGGRYTSLVVSPDALVMTLAEFEDMLRSAGKVIVPIEAVRAFQNLLN